MSMELEKQVVSLELAKKLKELGVNQESLYFWVEEKNRSVPKHNHGVTPSSPSAFTVAELGEILPDREIETFRHKGTWYCEYNMPNHCKTVSDGYEADARAKMLIYLIENNLLASL